MRPVALALAALLAALPLRATTYYVATTGDDGESGDLTHPWATLQHAAIAVGPGDTVYVRAGSYAAFELDDSMSGMPAQRITFAALPGELVSIVTDVPGRGAGINLEGASYVTVQGFHIADRATVGIRAVEGTGVHILDNVLTHNGRWGILTGCADDLLIAGNTASASVAEHGIYVGNSGDRPHILHNVVFDNHANGIHMNGDASIDCDTGDSNGVISDAVVEGNVAHGNGAGGGSGINCDGVQDSLIRNNLIYDTHASGISLYQEDGGGPSSGNRVENNTVVVASDGRWALNVTDDATATTVCNNILWSGQSFRGAITLCATCRTGFQSDHNVVESRFSEDDGNSAETLAAWRAGTGQDMNSLSLGNSTAGDTALEDLFAYLRGNDYHLAAQSVALDAGVTIADLPADLEQRARPVGSGYDVGALEGAALFGDGFEGRGMQRWSAQAP